MAKLYGLIGRNISYSFSAGYFNDKFERLGLEEHQYRNFDLDHIDEIRKVVLDNPDLKGLNVTIPYKESVIAYLDEIDPEAEDIGAVNTIAFKNGVLKGYNTDTHGFETSLTPLLTDDVRHALVLGTGGASKAVVHTLRKLGIGILQVSRTKAAGIHTYAELDETITAQAQLIVNCTPLGTFPKVDDKPDIPYQHLTSDHILYDLIYNPQETSFLKEGKKRGCTISNGYDMLVQQAEKAWQIWNQ